MAGCPSQHPAQERNIFAERTMDRNKDLGLGSMPAGKNTGLMRKAGEIQQKLFICLMSDERNSLQRQFRIFEMPLLLNGYRHGRQGL
jgi:hypothetical protein